MDMRFGDLDRLAAAELAGIDFGVFVATLAANQAASGIARAAAAARRLRADTVAPGSADETSAASTIGSRRGAFHVGTAASLRLQRSATEVKPGFTLAFQPSFKAPL